MVNDRSLSIIIVNYINYALTIKCVESVLNNVDNIIYEIIIVDNCSPNESYEMLNKKFKNYDNITVFKNDKNHGFGFGNNIGAKKARGEYLLFLNPDVIILKDAIQKMIAKIKENSDIGLLSGKLLNADYTVQYSCRRVIPIKQFFLCRTPFSKVVYKSIRARYNENYLMYDFDHKSDKSVDWVMGACMLIKKELFVNLGGFSKEYFMYFEDVDLCCKVRSCGKKVMYIPEAEMIHLHRQESIKSFNKMTLVHFKSMCKFYYKYYCNKFNIK